MNPPELSGLVGSPQAATPMEALQQIFKHGNRFRWNVADKEMRRGANWFLTGDGTKISVIAGWGTYCSPRPDFLGENVGYEGPYATVEAWLPKTEVTCPTCGHTETTDDQPASISVPELLAWIEDHGGLVAGPAFSERDLP